METRPQKQTTADIKTPANKAKIRLVPQYSVVKTRPEKPARKTVPVNKSPRTVEFTDEDRRIILQYYRSKSTKAHGTRINRASSAQLSKLKNSGQWNNRLQEKNLPFALESRLSPLPPGYTRKQIGHHLLIRNLNNNEVVDFIMDIAY